MKLFRIIHKNKIRNVYLTDKAYFDWVYFLMRIVGVSKIVIHDHIPGERTFPKFHKINGYVCKDRKSSLELSQAIRVVATGKTYLSPQVNKALSPKSQLGIDDFDIELLNLLSRGLSQDEISANFKGNGTSPNSLSTIEKHLNKLKCQFGANNGIHLIAITKDLGVV